MSDKVTQKPVVIFDGTCGFCSRLVVFALTHDARGELVFTSNTSPYGVRLLNTWKLGELSRDTLIVIAEGRAFIRSDAAVYIAQHLRAPYSYGSLLRYIPLPVRDFGYKVVAAVRHRLTRNEDACALLPPEQQARIISDI
jgi:predicted DCC family thiol-disulfide oxidoreductase YuxK